MREGKSGLFSLSDKEKVSNIIIVSLLGLFTIFSILFPNSFRAQAAKSGLSKIYHVYVDKQFVGKTNDLDIIDEIISAKLDEVEDDRLKPFIAEDVTYITELGFKLRYNNEQVTKALEEKLTVNVAAYGLKIDDQIIGYFKTERSINSMLEEYKQNFVSKRDLNHLKMKENASIFTSDTLYLENKLMFLEARKPLEIGERELTDVFVDGDVEVFEAAVHPKELLSKKQGMKILNNGAVEEEVHKIKKGEVLQSIARDYNLTVKEILALNPGLTEDSILQIGQEIKVTAFKPVFDVVSVEEAYVEETVAYETEIIESDKMYKGEQKVKQEGKNGKREVLYQITKKNGLETDREVLREKVTEKPQKKIIVKGTKVIPSRGSGKFTWPTNGGYISSKFGHRWGRLHKGIDIARPSNRTIKAADHGVVTFAGYHGGFGNKIVINHNNGFKTIYAHLSKINVRRGQVVEKGSAIGIMGTTGRSTGIHLHFEIHQNGVAKNPLLFY